VIPQDAEQSEEYERDQDLARKGSSIVPLMSQQLARERELILTRKTCNLRRKFRDAGDFREEAIKKDLTDRFYDSRFMATLYCAFDSVVHLPVEKGDGLDASHEVVSELFRDLRRIGEESVYGKVILASIPGVAIKTPTHPGMDELLHELFVGLTGTNGLRRLCPNYAYILGGYKCLPPIINADKTVSSWCATNAHPDDYVNYVIYEKIDGKSLADHLATCTFSQFFSWYVQLLLAVQIGCDTVGFTHYDLHDENVLLRPWLQHKRIAIPYEVRSGATWYVKTDLVATMIDFGMSHIEVRGEQFGKYGLEKNGVYATRSRPLYDAFKILGFSISQMYQTRNNECLKKSLGLYRIFEDAGESDDELLQQILDEDTTFHSFSDVPRPSEDSYDLWDYMEEVKERYGREWSATVTTSPPPNVAILTCLHACLSEQAAEKEIGGVIDTSTGIPTSVNIRGTTTSQITSHAKIIKAAPQSKRAALAKAALPRKIHQLRQEMREEHAQLAKQLDAIHDLSSLGIPRVADSAQLQDIMDAYVEPMVNFKDHYTNYRRKQELLNDYYTMQGEKLESAEFDFGPELQEWNGSYEQVYNKLNNLIVAAPNQATQSYMVNLMKQ
jgi:hypothetical protein